MDVGRLGASLARPGIDTRTWISIAIALEESEVDPAHGVFVNVQLVPTGEKWTARVPSLYAGNGFGLYAKIHADDELLVAIPSGDPAMGIQVIGRPWSATDLAPSDLGAHPDDVMLVLEADKNFDVKVQGAGLINLGDVAPTDFVSLAQLVLDRLNQIKTDFDTHIHPSGMGPTAAPTISMTAPQSVAATKVKAL